MLSHNSNLSDFVCSIPLCQLEADLGSMLNIFKYTNCDLVAVPLENNAWGTISSQDLLLLVAQAWQREGVAVVGHPKNWTGQKDTSHSASRDLRCLIKPAIAYLGNINLQEFLSNLQDDSLSHNFRQEYLIVNQLGILQGRLDRSKILDFLASTVNQVSNPNQSRETKQSRQSVINSVIDPEINSIGSIGNLIDGVDVPLKLETYHGKPIYTNGCWQELINPVQGKKLKGKKIKEPLADIAIATWWMKQQSNQHQEDLAARDQSHLNCCGTMFPVSMNIVPIQTKLKLAIQTLTSTFTKISNTDTDISNHSPVPSLDQKYHGNSWVNSPREIQIEQKQDWNYIKIPLTLTNQETLQEPDKSLLWLTLATKAGHNLPNLIQNFTTSALQAIANKLLKTVSHELKSPLTGIVGLSSLLKEQQLGELNQRQLQYTELIHAGGQKLMSIVHDLLELTGLTTSQDQLQPESIDLKFFCHQLYQKTLIKLQSGVMGESSFSGQGVQLKLDIAPELETVIADKSLLSAIFTHLILEAWQFLEPANDVLLIKAKNSDEGIEIIFSVDFVSDSPRQSSGLHLILAEYIAHITQADIKSVYSANGCQLTLFSPMTSSKLLQSLPSCDQTTDETDVSRVSKALPNSGNKISGELSGTLPHEPKVSITGESKPGKNKNVGQSPSRISPASVRVPDKTQNQKNLECSTNLTILCLYPEPNVIDSVIDNRNDLDFNLKDWAEQDWFNIDGEQKPHYQHRIIEADGLEQAHTLARIWKLDIILLDGYQIANPAEYLRSLQESEYLATLPIVTLDTKTTEAANQVEGLNVYPCLLPAECRSVKDLMQVIQIATGI